MTVDACPSTTLSAGPVLADPAHVGPLDSTLAFEGPEKLLEIWFAPKDNYSSEDGKIGLKAVPRERWEEMLDLVKCKVLSVIPTPQLDSYLLSESSMFVYPYRIILKTCGTTTLLHGLWRILELAAEYANLPCQVVTTAERPVSVPYRVFYSRKSYLFPQEQQQPHRTWDEEVSFLKEKLIGHAITVGDTTDDPWYLFYTKPSNIRFPLAGLMDQPSLSKRASVSSGNCGDDLEDESLEVLMTDLQPAEAAVFFEPTKENSLGLTVPTEGNEIEIAHELGRQVAEKCGLSAVYGKEKFPTAIVDSYLFSPCGFSANAVIPVPGKNGSPDKTYYWTVHVTPQESCSYASFETNVPLSLSGHTPDQLVEQIVKIFGAGRFTVNRFAPPSESVSADISRVPSVVGAVASLERPSYGAQLIRSLGTPKGLKRLFRYPVRRLFGGSPAGTPVPGTPASVTSAMSVASSAGADSGAVTPKVDGYSLTGGSYHFLPEYRLLFGTYARQTIEV